MNSLTEYHDFSIDMVFRVRITDITISDTDDTVSSNALPPWLLDPPPYYNSSHLNSPRNLPHFVPAPPPPPYTRTANDPENLFPASHHEYHCCM